MSAFDQPQSMFKSTENQSWNPGRVSGTAVDMRNPETRNAFQLPESQKNPAVSNDGQLQFSNPYANSDVDGSSPVGRESLNKAMLSLDFDVVVAETSMLALSAISALESNGTGFNPGEDNGTANLANEMTPEQQILADLQLLTADIAILFGGAGGESTNGSNTSSASDNGTGGDAGGRAQNSEATSTDNSDQSQPANISDNSSHSQQSTAGDSAPYSQQSTAGDSAPKLQQSTAGDSAPQSTNATTTEIGGNPKSEGTAGNTLSSEGAAPAKTNPNSSQTPAGSDVSSSASTGAEPVTSAGFDAGPSWANDTKIDNNNRGLVSPSYFAQEIPQNATYAAADLSNLKFPNQSWAYDEGEMVDERGMSPSQLESIPVYEADSDWTSNGTTGKELGTIEVPVDMSIPRPIATASDGTKSAGNVVTTFIQPDGEEMNFAKTYIGPNSDVGNGGPVLIGAPVGQTGWFGNEVALTNSDVTQALNDGTAPAHALGLVVPVDVLSNTDNGIAGPSLYADSAYKTEYTSSNSNLRMGSLLAIPKDVTAQELGLQTKLGGELLATMQKYGAYIADTTHGQNYFDIETSIGVANQVQQTGQASEFGDDLSKLVAASEVVTSNPNASSSG